MKNYYGENSEKIEKTKSLFLDYIDAYVDYINNGKKYGDVAILYRTNAQSRTFEERFVSSNIPYKIIGGINFYSRKEIKDLIAYLNLIYNKNDSVSLERVINVPKRGIGPKAIDNIRNTRSINKNMI